MFVLVTLNIFLNELDECACYKLEIVTELSALASMPEGRIKLE